MAIRVLEETGLLPHLNPGVLAWQDFQRLKPVAPSMGMMLETTATRLFTERGGPHFGSPDKDPAVRLRVLEDAGRCNVPFTTGILIGIGETLAERADSIFAIRKVARTYHGIQEVIVQNFRAKPDTKMRDVPDAELDDLAATIAVDPAGPRLEGADPGPAQPGRRPARPDPAGRHRRLGRRLPADPGSRQPRTPLARHRRTRRPHRGRRLHPARAPDHLPALPPRAVAGPAAGRARGRAGRPGHRPGRRGRPPARPALAGTRRRPGRESAAPTCT